MKRLMQILLLVLSLGLLTLPAFAQENQPVVQGRAQASFASWRVGLVFHGGRWHRRRYWAYDRPYYPYWQARRGYWQARRWRWEGRRERWEGRGWRRY